MTEVLRLPGDPACCIAVGDCLKVLELPIGSADLCFADPPFNYDRAYGVWNDSLKTDDFLAFLRQWIDRGVEALRPGGTLWFHLPDDWAAEAVVHMKSRGLKMRNWVIWHYRFGVCREGNFIASKAHGLYFAKPGGQVTWNGPAVLVDSDRAAVYGDARTQTKKVGTAGKRVPLDVWGGLEGQNWGRVQGNNAERRPLHDNQLPEEYLRRIILATTNPGDQVVDLFTGSGTTPTVARALGRRFVGTEINPEYARSAFERVQKGMVRAVA